MRPNEGRLSQAYCLQHIKGQGFGRKEAEDIDFSEVLHAIVAMKNHHN